MHSRLSSRVRQFQLKDIAAPKEVLYCATSVWTEADDIPPMDEFARLSVKKTIVAIRLGKKDISVCGAVTLGPNVAFLVQD